MAHLSQENHSFVRQMDSGSEEDIGTGDAGLFEDDLGVNEFAETLELIESNAEEIDNSFRAQTARKFASQRVV